MDTNTFVFLSCTLSFGAPLALAVRELVLLRRDRGQAGGSWDRHRPPTPTPPTPRGGTGERPRVLPACLIEAARGAPATPARTRPELETV